MAWHDVLDRSGLVGDWAHSEAVGATVGVDDGPNGLSLTYESAKVDGPNLVNGLGTSFRGDGTAQRSRTVDASTLPGGNASSVISLSTFTIGGMFYFYTTPPSGGRFLFGRNGAFTGRYTSGGSIDSNFTASSTDTAYLGSLAVPATKNPIPLSTPVFVVLTRKDWESAYWLNAEKEHATERTANTLASVSSPLEFGAVNNANFLDAAWQGLFLFNRVLDPGEIREIYDEGRVTTALEQAQPRNYVYDTKSKLIINSPASSENCKVCNGSRRANEPAVEMSGDFAHPYCYAASREDIPLATITSSSTQTQVAAMSAKLMYRNFLWLTRRNLPNDSMYLDPATWLPYGNGTILANASARDYLGLIAQAGFLHQWAGVSGDSPIVEAAFKLAQGFFNLQDTQFFAGSNGWTYAGIDAAFNVVELTQAYLLLQNVMSEELRERWYSILLRMVQDWRTVKGSSSEKTWYTNGNAEAQEWLMLCLFNKIHQARTSDDEWWDEAEYQYGHLTAPVQTGNNVGFGWFLTVDDMVAQPDGSTSKGYFAEKGSGSPGLDWNYASFQCDIMLRGHLWFPDDVRWKVHTNALYNLIVDRINTSTWILDGSGGSRINNASLSFFSAAPMLMKWILGRTTYTDTQLADQWNKAVYSGHRDNPHSPSWWRSYYLAGFMAAILSDAEQLP
jgi:hypothetical protein